MKFLVDQQLPPALADWFKDRGHDAEHTDAIGLGAASDSTIWDYAVRGGFIIVTKDADFASMRLRSGGPQVLWLRIGNASVSVLLAKIDSHWRETLAFLEAGEAIVEA